MGFHSVRWFFLWCLNLRFFSSSPQCRPICNYLVPSKQSGSNISWFCILKRVPAFLAKFACLHCRWKECATTWKANRCLRFSLNHFGKQSPKPSYFLKAHTHTNNGKIAYFKAARRQMKKPNKTTKPQSFLNKRQKLAKATAWMTTTRRERGGEIKKNWFPYARWLPMIIEMYRTLLYVLYVVRYPRRQWKFVWLCFVALPFSRLLGRSLLFIKRQQWLLLVLLLSILASEFVFIFLPLTLSRSLRNTFFLLALHPFCT